MTRVSIAGATGYTGLELIRLLLAHSQIEIHSVTADSNRGKSLSEVCPSLSGILDQELVALDSTVARNCDVLFLALPHGAAMGQMQEFLDAGCRVIDLSADFRLADPAVFETWYKTPHENPQALPKAVYGLPELHREAIRKAQLVANPGCYPTSVILAAAPLMDSGWIDPDSIIADSKSGVSGAGRKLNAGTQYCEASDGVSAYGLTQHRHTPEIEQELSRLSGRKIQISFSPHLMPMTRGILSTVYASLKEEVDQEAVWKRFQEFYKDEPFVRVLPLGKFSDTHHVARSNYCDLAVVVDPRTQRVIVTSAIDNLMKGASSQAVQNMNLMLGFPEMQGLDSAPIFP